MTDGTAGVRISDRLDFRKMPAHVRRVRTFVALLALGIVGVCLEARQAAPSRTGDWWANRFSAEGVGLAVAVRGGAGCQAAIVTGYTSDKVYAVTTATPFLLTPPPGQEAVSIGRVEGVNVKPGTRDWTFIHSFAARILRQDSRLIALEIADERFARWAAGLKYDILGDASRLVRRDSVYTLGCQLGMPAPPGLTLLAQVTDTVITFQGYPPFTPEPWGADPFVGGAVIQAFGGVPLLVAMATNPGTRVQARPINDVVHQLEAWRVPVMLTAVGTRAACRYTVEPVGTTSPLGVEFSAGEGQRAVISVQTTDSSCPWTAFPDGASWIRVTASSLRGDAGSEQRGPGTVTVETSQRNLCGQAPRRAAVNVAGHVFHVEQARC
jgi:hypothetical protein